MKIVPHLATILLIFSYPEVPANADLLPRQTQLEISRNHAKTTEINDTSFDPYIIGPGDKLRLTIYDAPELSDDIDVLNDGTFSVPIVGSINLNGHTIKEATSIIRDLLNQHLFKPDLQIKIIRSRPIRVSLVGEVVRPGIYSLTSNESVQPSGAPITNISGIPTVVDAIQKAGGITQIADLREVIVRRRLPGKKKDYKYREINLIDLIIDGDHDQNLYLFDRDTIFINASPQMPDKAVELAHANLSPQVIKVNVIGEVANPGTIQLPSNTPLVQAVLAAGGPLVWRANSANVELLRINRDGTISLNKFAIKKNKGLSDTESPLLRDGDTLRVNRSFLANVSDAFKAVSGIISIWSLFNLMID